MLIILIHLTHLLLHFILFLLLQAVEKSELPKRHCVATPRHYTSCGMNTSLGLDVVCPRSRFREIIAGTIYTYIAGGTYSEVLLFRWWEEGIQPMVLLIKIYQAYGFKTSVTGVIKKLIQDKKKSYRQFL